MADVVVAVSIVTVLAVLAVAARGVMATPGAHAAALLSVLLVRFRGKATPAGVTVALAPCCSVESVYKFRKKFKFCNF